MATSKFSSSPKISVVMPVYNAAATVGAAIDSILSQSVDDFELIVIDDSSTDKCHDVIKGREDRRIRVVKNIANLGVAATLNRGILESAGEFVARMDADDISLPTRFAQQLELFDSDRSLSICGTYAELFGEGAGVIKHPVEPSQLRCKLLFDTCFAHPTVMFRRDDFQRHELRYEPIRHFEDLELWQRAMGPLNGANIPEVLLQYRVTSGSALKGGDPVEQREQYRVLDVRALTALGIRSGKRELALHHSVRRIVEETFDLDDIEGWLIKLLAANEVKKLYPFDAMRAYFGRLWFLACHHATGLGLLKMNRLKASKLYTDNCCSGIERARFLARYRSPGGAR